MKIEHLTGTIFERHLDDNVRANAEQLKAILEYNIMMEMLEDPSAEDDETDNAK